jgi:hypothetical protein
MSRPDTLFPRHWRYYITLKRLMVVGATVLASKLVGAW